MFGKMVYKKEAWELIETGVLTPVKINTITINYDAPYDDFSKNLIEDGIISTEKYMEEKFFFHHFEPRTELIAKLIKVYKTNTLIIVDTIEYCTILKEYLTDYIGDDFQCDIIHGKVNNRDYIFDTMRSSKSHCIIATYGTMAVGISIRNLEDIHFPDGGKSEIRVRQTIGRGTRLYPLKDFCRVFDYQDNITKSSFQSHARFRNRYYKEQKFPVKNIKISI